MIPLEEGQAVSAGWPTEIGGKPTGVTWHWTVTRNLTACRRVLGGRNAIRRGEASAHYGVGRLLREGVDRYVSLENRSWHAGVGQTLRWDGETLTDLKYKGSRSTIGVETVSEGPAVAGVRPGPDWIWASSPDGARMMLIEPWTEEQIVLMIGIGKEIVRRWPHIRPKDHHGHSDLCPGYKLDVAGFPFARVLRGIYDDEDIPDVWTPFWTVRQRRQALAALGYGPGTAFRDGEWGPECEAALRRFQSDVGLVVNGMWTVFVSRAAYAELALCGSGPLS